MARSSRYGEIPEGYQWPDTIDETGEVDFVEYWIRSNNGETVDSLFGVFKGIIYGWATENRRWSRTRHSLPEFAGLGGSSDYWKVSEDFAQRLKAKWPSESPIRIEDV